MAWDETKPPANGDLISAEIRDNWVALQRAIGGQNMVRDSEHLIWPAGDAAAPAHYRLSGAGAAIVRVGLGRPETVRYQSDFCARVTSGAAVAGLYEQTLIGTSGFKTRMRGQRVSVGCALRCQTAGSLRVGIFDGTGTTYSEPVSHTVPSDGFAWMTATRTLQPTADRVVFRVEVAQGIVTGYIADPAVLWGEIPPSGPVPSRAGRFILSPGTQVGGLAAMSTINSWRFAMPMPALVRWTSLLVGTAPAAQAAVIDVNRSGVSMYSARPQISPGSTSGGAPPDGPYTNRCFARGHVLSCDQDQVGVGSAGADQTIVVDALCFIAPQDVYLGVGEEN